MLIGGIEAALGKSMLTETLRLPVGCRQARPVDAISGMSATAASGDFAQTSR